MGLALSRAAFDNHTFIWISSIFPSVTQLLIYCLLQASCHAGDGNGAMVSVSTSEAPAGSHQSLSLSPPRAFLPGSASHFPLWPVPCSPALLCSADYAHRFTPHFVPLLSALVGPLPTFLPWIPKLYKETPLPSLLHEEQHEMAAMGGH